MSNFFFRFKKFIIYQDRCAMKVTTDACLYGAWAANKISNYKNVENILDIGSGTGLLSLILAQNTHATIDAIEIDKDAFEQAGENFVASPWGDRINIFHADARNFIFPHLYDVIICNPPFYEKELKSVDKRKNTAHHNDGLLLNEALAIIKKTLQPDGVFYLLLPYKRNDECEALFTRYSFSITKKTLTRQSTKHDYFRIMIAGKHNTSTMDITPDELSIRDDQQQYTPKFTELLKDYYLQL